MYTYTLYILRRKIYIYVYISVYKVPHFCCSLLARRLLFFLLAFLFTYPFSACCILDLFSTSCTSVCILVRYRFVVVVVVVVGCCCFFVVVVVVVVVCVCVCVCVF